MAGATFTNRFREFREDRERLLAASITKALVIAGSEVVGFTPQHYGNLINSQFREVQQQGAQFVGIFGYTAEYALAVHNAPGTLKGKPRPKENGIAQGNYWGPRGEPHFVTKGFEAAEPNIRAVISGAIKT